MNRKKLFYGIAAGTAGYGIYLLAKDKLKPITVKALSGALTAGECAKNFIKDVTEEAKEMRGKKIRELVQRNQEMELQAIKEDGESEMGKYIEELKAQIKSMEDKIKSFTSE